MKHFFLKRKKRVITAISLAVITGLVCLFSHWSPTVVRATEETRKKLQDAKEQKEQTEGELESVNDNIDSMENTVSNLQQELNSLNNELSNISNNLSELESQIASTNETIAQTQAEIDEAKSVEAAQYAAMKKRVKFVYEEQSNILMNAIFDENGMSSLLNLAQYMESLSEYDRDKLTEYETIRALIEEKERQLQEQMASLENYKAEVQSEQNRVSQLVNNTAYNISDYGDQIANAEALADSLANEIEEQNSNISALEAQLQKEIAMSQLAANSAWRNISEVQFAGDDRYLLANLIYCEAGGESYDGQLAVGAVVINRVLSSVYPGTIVGVIYQGGQFAPVSDGHLAIALANDSATASCYQAADAAMGGASNVGNCVYFRTPVPGLSGINIGNHVFY